MYISYKRIRPNRVHIFLCAHSANIIDTTHYYYTPKQTNAQGPHRLSITVNGGRGGPQFSLCWRGDIDKNVNRNRKNYSSGISLGFNQSCAPKYPLSALKKNTERNPTYYNFTPFLLWTLPCRGNWCFVRVFVACLWHEPIRYRTSGKRPIVRNFCPLSTGCRFETQPQQLISIKFPPKRKDTPE